VLSAQSVPMTMHATMKYIMPSLSNNFTATEELCFLRGSYRSYIMSLDESCCYEKLVVEAGESSLLEAAI
jgi:hypothetical protein